MGRTVKSARLRPLGPPEPLPESVMAAGKTLVWSGAAPAQFVGIGNPNRDAWFAAQIQGLDAAAYEVVSDRHGYLTPGQPVLIPRGDAMTLTFALRGSTDRAIPFTLVVAEYEGSEDPSYTATYGQAPRYKVGIRREMVWVPHPVAEDFGIRMKGGEVTIRPWTREVKCEVVTANLSGFPAAMRPFVESSDGEMDTDEDGGSISLHASSRLPPLHQQRWECIALLGPGGDGGPITLNATGAAEVPGMGAFDRLGGQGGFTIFYQALLRAPKDWAFVAGGVACLVMLGLLIAPLFSKGGAAKILPDLTGKTPQQAHEIGAKQGFAVANALKYEASDSVPPGQVSRTEPPPGRFTPANWKKLSVVLVVSSGEKGVEVPNVASPSHWMTAAQAESKLSAKGLKAQIAAGEFSELVPKGKVMRTEPVAGQKVAPGTLVLLTLSKGLEPKPATPKPEPTDGGGPVPPDDVTPPEEDPTPPPTPKEDPTPAPETTPAPAATP